MALFEESLLVESSLCGLRSAGGSRRDCLATTALLSATFAWLPLRGTKSTLWRILLIPLALVFAIVGYQLSRPLGPWLQEYVTTEADLGNLQIVDIVPVRKGVHRVITK